jgi:hypothetical protein
MDIIPIGINVKGQSAPVTAKRSGIFGPVIAGLDPAIHEALPPIPVRNGGRCPLEFIMDARVKPGHDTEVAAKAPGPLLF